jgi:predicted transcriptional regulator
VTKDGYRKNSLKDVVDKFFDKDYLDVVNTLVKDEKISLEELKELIKMVENQ